MRLLSSAFCTGCFNTQPPEGGWEVFAAVMDVSGLFQHTAA
ncbi:hypothetical protein HMPREF1051_1264 [Neisseria sicca VK64]|uniref:Uncharacterized protein n=1 Tax=Neisseria sicca VK64 TaxID=1095748 RepID=I2NX57_NEISI|nr:hypothetical protein HMPREF1051_1264 [Neisseria sicca VK64]